MKNILLGALLGIFSVAAAVYLFIKLGAMPVATKEKPLPFEKFLAKTSIRAAIGKSVDLQPPFAQDDTHLRSGAKIYATQCATCHGYFHEPPTAIAKGMFPPPPQLLPPKEGVTDDPIGKIYWKVKNGIRLTGMPGFEAGLTDVELWDVSLMLLNADKLPRGILEGIRSPSR